MPSRIDVELTSARPDGTWTWRAAGAREPKGVVEASVLPEGAKVGDIPIEQPNRFEFAVNLRTAKAIGIELPTAILLRADEVIE